ncbi:hypothetical protein B0O80DRAFT_299686 [Mortierella sp. GBAus27b]|nr:hypothetical protein B0O80DRAFT_299686 [Mortierella sp. GBAus27b]
MGQRIPCSFSSPIAFESTLHTSLFSPSPSTASFEPRHLVSPLYPESPCHMPNKDKQKRLVIDILNGQPNGPDGSYLFYGVPEGTTLIRGRVRFSTNYECKGEAIQYSFLGKASCSFPIDGDNTVTGREPLFEQVFVMDVKQPNKQQRILPGEYEECFEVSLPSTLPSSSQNENARISYIITARLIRKWSLDIVETKEIWFLTTVLPQPTPTRLHQPTTPSITFGHWKEALPCSIILPSNVLYLGQAVPVTIRLDPFLPNSVAAGRTMRFVSARLGLKQYLTLTSSNGNHSTSRYKRKILDYDLLHWPKHEVPGFHDTVLIQLPMIPDLSPTTETNVCSIRHSINLLVEIAVKGLAGMLKFKASVRITGPRPPDEWIPHVV